MRKVLRVVGAAFVLLVLALAVGLVWAHVAIRRERVPLPEAAALAAAPASAERPMRLSWINTASQAMPRSAVLDSSGDPRPDEPYTMSHPSFVLEWADGRILLVDAGMPRDDAVSFGAPLQWLGGAEPIVPHRSVAEGLGDERSRVRGVVFTHLHVDHVAGVRELCVAGAAPIAVPMTPAQAERGNYTTRPGRAVLEETACVEVEQLSDAAVQPLPGFPGVVVVDAGGHTPGSQLVLAEVAAADGPRRYAFTGDIVNHTEGIRLDLRKPPLYSLLVVPEDDARLGELRRRLASLERDHGYTLLVAHDQNGLEAAGVPPFRP